MTDTMQPASWKDRLIRVGIVGTGGILTLITVLFLAGLYASYKYYQMKSFEKHFAQVIANK